MNDLRMNNTREYPEESLIAKTLGLHDVVRVEWDAFDLLLDKIRVEVNSSAYLQAWEQPRPSRIDFGGLRGTRYHPRHGSDPGGETLNEHVYVFCVQTAMTREEYRPRELSQWLFSLVKRSALELRGSTRVGLDTVVRLACGRIPWAELLPDVLLAAEIEEVDDTA